MVRPARACTVGSKGALRQFLGPAPPAPHPRAGPADDGVKTESGFATMADRIAPMRALSA
jgi:hypothetical protein